MTSPHTDELATLQNLATALDARRASILRLAHAATATECQLAMEQAKLAEIDVEGAMVEAGIPQTTHTMAALLRLSHFRGCLADLRDGIAELSRQRLEHELSMLRATTHAVAGLPACWKSYVESLLSELHSVLDLGAQARRQTQVQVAPLAHVFGF